MIKKASSITGQELREMFAAATAWLEKNASDIDSLNVFPVPDGDTGTNMLLTMRSSVEEAYRAPDHSVSGVAQSVAKGALLGARGNPCVLLSQILRGMAKALEMKEYFTTSDFARALRNASDTAYHSISQPVEGTILTVIREAAEAAWKQVEKGSNLKQTITAVATQARDTVKKTPDLLPKLREAGVVDAGGKGLFYVFLGMKQFISKEVTQFEEHAGTIRLANVNDEENKYGFDLQFLLEGKNLNLSEIRDKITKMGESVLVVGDEQVMRVHIHTKEPRSVLDYCATRGELKDIVKEDMDKQAAAFESLTGKRQATGFQK